MKMEDNITKTKIKWKTNQSTKINLIGCDTIVNSPSLFLPPLFKTTEGVVVGFQIFAWAPNCQKNSNQQQQQTR